MSAFFHAVPQAPPLPEIRKAVSHAWLTYQHAKYSALARALPRLLRDAQVADNAHANSEQARVATHLLGQVYQIASATLRKLGENELSLLAADRSITVFQRSSNQLLAGLASYRFGSALLALGQVRSSLGGDVGVANRLASRSRGRRQERLNVYGMLLLNGAMVKAGQGPGGGQNYWTGFDPTNVQLNRAAPAAELGDGHAAVEHHERLGPESLSAVPPEHQAHHYLNIARGYTQISDVEKAGEMLLESDRLAPSEIRCRPLPHEVLADVLRRTRATPPAPIAELAEQMELGI